METKGYHSWNLKTDSPERVLNTIGQMIEDIGYHLQKHPVESEWIPFAPASDFTAEVVGRKIVARPRPKPFIIGIVFVAAAIALFLNSIPGKVDGTDIFMMIVGVALSVLGVLLVIAGSKLFRLSLVGRMRRDSSEIGADLQNQQIIVEIVGGHQALWRRHTDEQGRESKAPREQQILKQNFQELQYKLEAILPSLAID